MAADDILLMVDDDYDDSRLPDYPTHDDASAYATVYQSAVLRALATESGKDLITRAYRLVDDLAAAVRESAEDMRYGGYYGQGLDLHEPPGPPTPSRVWGWNPRVDRFWEGVARETWDTNPNVLLTRLLATVGGEEALNVLTSEPLPRYEPLRLAHVPEDIHGRVRATDELLTPVALEMFDGELLTSARRILSRVAEGDPRIFRRRSQDRRAACALLWIAARLNGRVEETGTTAGTFTTAFGYSGSPADRARTMQDAIGAYVVESPQGGWGPQRPGTLVAGDPSLLTGERRARLIADRNRLTGSA